MRRKTTIWAGVFTLFTFAQLTSLYGLDKFFQSPSLPVSAAEQPEDNQEKPVKIPEEAQQFAFSKDRQHIAYTTKDQQLMIDGKEGVIFHQKTGPVSYMQWLGNTNTLLFFVQGSYLDAYLLQLNASKPLLIHEWYGNQREVKNTYFSPYLEYLYIEMNNKTSSSDEIYKYEAVNGMIQLPLGKMQITHIDYDELSDVMYITNAKGDVWRYAEDRLYRPDGSEVKSLPHHTQNSETKPSLTQEAEKNGSNPVSGNQHSGKTSTGTHSLKENISGNSPNKTSPTQ